MSYSEEQLKAGFEAAFINGTLAVDSAYKPSFVLNDYAQKKKVLTEIEDELRHCDSFDISVAFITMSGVEPLLQILQELERKNVPGRILTTNYLTFSDPEAIRKLHGLKNITIRMFDSESRRKGFHTKGYIFKSEEVYRIIIGSSNLTEGALLTNYEWNTRLVSTRQGEVAAEVIKEFDNLWKSEYTWDFDDFFEAYKERYRIIKHQRDIAKKETTPSLEKYALKPNSMQEKFVVNLRKLVEEGKDRALLISATGTGKTYASAFGMRELGFKRVLFVVHRNQLALQTKIAYENVFSKNVSMGLACGGSALRENKDKDYLFATIQTLASDCNYSKFFNKDEFDAIILDETHHSPADIYQRIMRYFRPKLWLGMTATPDKMDDNIKDRNVYELYNHNIVHEIRLQQAMEEDLLCPFHYFGIADLEIIGEDKDRGYDFSNLVSDERVRHIVEQASYYGYSGDKVKGLIFCRSIEESEQLSNLLNCTINPDTNKYFRTIALNGNSSLEERKNAFERLAADEDGGIEPLDYILSKEILNEGIDIVEVNQVIMLRPTMSPIVFIQQLGRGLRKARGKEFVVILDFIGNYKKNFMIPIALSGDRTYNKDNIRRYVISGNNCIPGASTVHFDEISREKIFASIDKISGMKEIIRESYTNLRNRLGRIPYLKDFYDAGEVDPLVIIREYKTYHQFVSSVEKNYTGKITEHEQIVLEYLSKTVLSGTRPYELEILKEILQETSPNVTKIREGFSKKYGVDFDMKSYENALEVLQGKFVSKAEEYERYRKIDIITVDENWKYQRLQTFSDRLRHEDFNNQLDDIIEVGLRRYNDLYKCGLVNGSPFVLDEKYSRRDVSLLMNCGKDLSSTMYGKKTIGDDVFIFVTYHKVEAGEDEVYKKGKPDYPDSFDNNVTFRWVSQIGKGIDSSYVKDVLNAKRKHLFVQKSDKELNFYYLGQFDVISSTPNRKKDNKGKEKDIAELVFRMHHAVREDILRYLNSYIDERPKTKKKTTA